MNRFDSPSRTEAKLAMSRPMVVSILSGKGGVGKSVIAFNLAERAAALGHQTLLVDADIACGNLHILANVDPADGLERFVADKSNLADSVVAYNQQLSMLAGSAAGQVDSLSTVPQIAQFAAKLRRQSADYDLIVIDHSSGISSTAAVLASASDLNLLVLVPELTSISDCYGLYKYLHQANGSTHCRFLFNRVESDNEAQYLWARLAAMVEQYLGRSPQLAGVLFDDPIFRQAVAGQKPVSALTSDSPVLHSLENMIRGLFPAVPATAADHHSGEINILTASADIRE